MQKVGSYSKNKALLLIALGWLVYTTSYLGKVNYSANITQFIEFYDITKSQAGVVPTFFFFSYGIGQVLHGLLCKKYNIKWIIFLSLIVSATINLIIAVGVDFSVIKWLWLINGFVLSILWPTLIRLISETLPQDYLGTSSVVMGTTVAIGTLFIYGLSSIFVAFNKFKLSFYTAAVAVIIVAIIWLLLYNKVTNNFCTKNNENKTDIKVFDTKNKDNYNKKTFMASVYVLCFCAIGVNLIKDGLTTWVPSILKEEFLLTDSLSILLTLFLPILAIFGNAFALKLHKKIPDYVTHSAIVFIIIALVIGGIIGSLVLKLVAFMLIGLVIVSFLASSLNSLITSIFPLFIRGMGNSGLYAGVLNGFCYLGSTISSYGLGIIADNFGWITTFIVLIVFCALVTIAWGIYNRYIKY